MFSPSSPKLAIAAGTKKDSLRYKIMRTIVANGAATISRRLSPFRQNATAERVAASS
jgi:hypothetical protein